MTASLAPLDAIAESIRMIDTLERHRADLPAVESMLHAHRQIHHDLTLCHDASEAAVNAWRAALARRWDYEVAGRRLYKQVFRQIADTLGELSPQIQMLSRGGAEANSSPSELLKDLRRIQACLMIEASQLPFAAERLRQIEEICSALELAISAAQDCEHRRRNAVLDNRMARESFRRICEETFGKLSAYYGSRFADEFPEFAEITAS
ncbi:MAG: hypothetical protein SH847_10540 [Roseiflexaceae bacterium]|nr:hypothetical protein [Roseiflexaceae bacterium]